MNSSDLAIIIPAYKASFLDKTLQSFSLQTNKNFTIYIGDDNSPENIEDIVSKFTGILPIRYFRFSENLGSKSLTKQWERCIELSHEKWIWLFSDDDVVDSNCVQVFYESVVNGILLYKFQTKIIDSNGNLVKRNSGKNKLFRKSISSSEFILNRLKCNGFRSFAVEYIFSRDLFAKYRFIDFPLAWSSDDATWFMYSIDSGRKIMCMNGFVSWRESNINISNSRDDKIINNLKISASIMYCIWLKKSAQELFFTISDSNILYWFSIQLASIKYELGFKNYINFIEKTGLDVSEITILRFYLVIKYYHFRNSFR